ncbi:hypothetical protein ASE01_09725 [Nocardioides sp. Root190]|uniref:DUF3048 domain-containing protein n=1 Tax=Nocardioides sp. Root190 TaxID=1736488 RepID=UPI0006F88B3E|nr:DUF3048 domain-containing protein [Nocardioides sp. Root190]KRB77033.1 hypothetical protein ASE01_09725 [Nocardioides sp. Root190]
MRVTSLRSALPASLVVLSLVLAGCGGGEDKDKPESGDTPAEATPTPEEPAIWPLTGIEAAAGDSVALDHPVLVTKIDNSTSSSPQVGLGKADLVVEELVEGGITRLAAFYYSKLPGDVGPVRSMRASDIGIVSPVGGVITTSGAAGVTIDRINKAGIKFFQEGGPGFYRKSGRSAPYNLFTSLKKVAKAVEDGKDERPADYLPWGTAADLPAGAPASSISAHFGSHTTNWKFRGGRYVNTNSNAAEGDRFQPDSVLVLRVEVVDAGYRDPAGNFVPESRFRGGGAAQLFHNGQVVEGEWSKDKLKSALTLTTAEGELTVPAGKVWIELVPVDSAGGEVLFGK